MIPENEPGSSIMPGKVNPTQCEALTMIAVQVMANDVAVGFGGAGGYLEMNVYKPLIIFNITHSITIMTDGCVNFRKFLIEGTKPNLKKINEYVERSLMLVTALSPVIGYDKASKIAHYAMDNDLTLKAAALKLGFVTEAEFDRVVDPSENGQTVRCNLQLTGPSTPSAHTKRGATHENRRYENRRRKRGVELLQDPSLNKSTAFTEAEKQALGLVGLVPDVTETEDLQLRRVMMQLGQKTTDLDRYIYLINLLDHDETLFYRTIMSDPARFLPIVYDPTIGEACLKFGHIFRGPRGMYLSIKRRGTGEGGPAKLAVERCSVHLRHRRRPDSRPGRPRRQRHGDSHRQAATLHGLRRRAAAVSTADVSRRGHQQRAVPARSAVSGPAQDAPADRGALFVRRRVRRGGAGGVSQSAASTSRTGPASDAVHLLQRYRDKYCVYNDDVQGTAGITLAGMINAAKLKGTKLKDEKYLFLGAGSAGIGLADLLCSALVCAGNDAQGRAVAGLHVRHQRSARIDPQGPRRLPEALCASACADHAISSPPSKASSRPRSSASARSAAPSRRKSSRPCRASTNAR